MELTLVIGRYVSVGRMKSRAGEGDIIYPSCVSYLIDTVLLTLDEHESVI